MSKKLRSWVWQYADREGEVAYCKLCDENQNNSFSCPGGSTGSIGRHLMSIHSMDSKSHLSGKRKR